MKELLLLPVHWYYKAPCIRVSNHRSGQQGDSSAEVVRGVQSNARQRGGPWGYWSSDGRVGR